MKTIKIVVALAVLGVLAALGVIYSGLYPAGADTPHNALTYWALDTLRERSVAKASAGIKVPPLDDPQMLMAGGADYNDMCAGCHLKPGKTQSDMTQGLYPKPPNLSKLPSQQAPLTKDLADGAAARQFWIIKHGIKASAMPAWGPTHDDARIWSMVAFLQKLPTLTPDQYQILTAREDGDSMDHGDMDHAGMAAMTTAPPSSASAQGPSDSEPAAVVDRFQKALVGGDTTTASSLLDPAVKIFESGDIERSREEYASHHLGADAQFMKTATVKLLSRSGDAVGDLAWVGTESTISATASGKPVDIVSTETMVLKKAADGWRITHIHWSSRSKKDR